MTSVHPRTAVLGPDGDPREVAWDSPVAAADDAGLRGDGFFETLLVHGGPPARVVRLDAHLDRFERSAAAFAVPLVRRRWADVAHLLLDELPADAEAVLRLSLSRSGLGLATLRPVPQAVVAGRAGISVVTLPRGTVTTPQAPWLLAAAKTSSYAVNSAALREAARRGADDALFVDADGLALEGPTANLLWHVDGRWHTPPPAGRAVLPGTTLAAVRERFDVHETPLRPGDLDRRAGAWLLSSLRGAAPVLRLDGVELAPADGRTEVLREIALAPER